MEFDTIYKGSSSSSSTSATSSSTQNTQQDQNTTKTNPKKKLPSSKYKGVVPQSNARWGAQLYNGHKRVWLGTFDSEEQAAEAHDLAAIRFRGVHAAANFPTRHYLTRRHLEFIAAHSMPQLVAMLRCDTYHHELSRFTRTGEPGSGRERLFEKVLTSSDVGKGTLHRLVIPKHHAERDLPAIDLRGKEGKMLNFEELGGAQRLWRFKYCYWGGSKNYVFTKGWGHFVKIKGLKPGDSVTFYGSVDQKGFRHRRLYIESSSDSGSDSFGEGGDNGVGNGVHDGSSSGSVHLVGQASSKMLRLFGFDVCLVPSLEQPI